MEIELPDGTFRDTVDMIEVNTHHDDEGFPVWTQLIFWDWDSVEHDWKVVAWKMYTDELWIENEEHKKQWMKYLREYCDKNPQVNFTQAKGKYKGEFTPIPGQNYPKRKNDRFWYLIFYHDKKRIEVKAKVFRETYTQTDPEVDNREKYPELSRRGLNGLGTNNSAIYHDPDSNWE